MMFFSRRLFISLVALAALLPGLAGAQELRVQRTPFAAFLDFKALAKAPETPLPIWLRSFQRIRASFADRTVAKTTFRVRIDQLDDQERDFLLRIFFDDWREDAIIVTGRDEAGVEKFVRGPFGAG